MPNVFDEAIDLINERGWLSGGGELRGGRLCVAEAVEEIEGTLYYNDLLDCLRTTSGDDCEFVTTHNDHHISSQEEAIEWLRRASVLYEERGKKSS